MRHRAQNESYGLKVTIWISIKVIVGLGFETEVDR